MFNYSQDQPSTVTTAHEFVTDWQLSHQNGQAPGHAPPMLDGPPPATIVTIPIEFPGIAIVRPAERDLGSTREADLRRFRGEILEHVLPLGCLTIALDLAAARFGAGFLGMTVLLSRQIAAYGRCLCVSGDAAGLFMLTGISCLIPTYPDLDTLLQSRSATMNAATFRSRPDREYRNVAELAEGPGILPR